MKKIKSLALAFIFILMFVPSSFALTMHTTNQFTVAWDASTTDEDGDNIVAPYGVIYRVFIVNLNDVNKVNKIKVYEGPALQCTITMSAAVTGQGSFWIGGQSIKTKDGEIIDGAESPIVWTEDPAVCANDEAFGIRYVVPPISMSGFTPK